MKINRLLITCIAGAILSSCGLMGPSYQKPQVTTPTNWSSTDNLTQLESANLGQIAWWKKFNDPMLNQLISQALAQNNNLQIAIGNVLQAKAALSQVNMNWVPTVPIGAAGFAGQVFNSSFTNNSGNPGLNYNSNNQSFDGYGAGFIPSYSLNIFNQIK
ncbi:MAG: TolC family protein, partial [Burkholderiales bacterium]|nr:TolC family protein [Burkholderiales bacterium]